MSYPPFAHPLFERLYERDYFIEEAVLREILALGPEMAVPELLKITDATLNDFLADELPGDDWLANYFFFHALYLLHELHAPEAFDVYRRLLRLDADSTEFWFGDDVFEDLPNLLARAAETRLPELLALLDDPEIIPQHRLVASSSISRLAKEQPALRPGISAFLQRYLHHISTHPDQARQLFPPDTSLYSYELEDYLGLLLADIQDAGLRELEPEIRALHRLDLVDESISGGEDDIDFNEVSPLLPSPGIFARYQELRDDPDSYSPFHPDAAAIAVRRAQEEAEYARLRHELSQKQARQQPRTVAAKIGRNDPCPCGSGKKYKKCHGA